MSSDLYLHTIARRALSYSAREVRMNQRFSNYAPSVNATNGCVQLCHNNKNKTICLVQKVSLHSFYDKKNSTFECKIFDNINKREKYYLIYFLLCIFYLKNTYCSIILHNNMFYIQLTLIAISLSVNDSFS